MKENNFAGFSTKKEKIRDYFLFALFFVTVSSLLGFLIFLYRFFFHFACSGSKKALLLFLLLGVYYYILPQIPPRHSQG